MIKIINMWIYFNNLISFIINFQQIHSYDIIDNEELKNDILQTEKDIIYWKKKLTNKFSEFDAKNNYRTVSKFMNLNNMKSESLSKFKEMETFFDNKKEDKYYECLLNYAKTCLDEENYELREFINEHEGIQLSYLILANFLNDDDIKDKKHLIKLIDSIFIKYKDSLKKLKIFKCNFFNIKLFDRNITSKKRSDTEIKVKLRIEDLHKTTNVFSSNENKEIIKVLITNNDIRKNLKIESFLSNFMNVEKEYWCLFDKIRASIDFNDLEIILNKVENCIKKYNDIKKVFFDIKSAYSKNLGKTYKNYRSSDKKANFRFIPQYLDLKNLFKEVENLFSSFKYNPKKEYIDIFNEFMRNRIEFLDFCCNIDLKNFYSYELNITSINYFFQNFLEIKHEYNIMFSQDYKKNNNREFDIILRKPLPLGEN